MYETWHDKTNKMSVRPTKNQLSLQLASAQAGLSLYHIPITDTTLELSVFWPSGTESQINELRLSESILLSFKTRLTSVTCFCGDVTYTCKVNCKHGTRDGKHVDMTSGNVTLWQTFLQFFGIKDQNRFSKQKECQKRHIINILL